MVTEPVTIQKRPLAPLQHPNNLVSQDENPSIVIFPRGDCRCVAYTGAFIGAFSLHTRLFGIQVIREASNATEPEVQSLIVHSTITTRFATTLVTSVLRNPKNESQEASFSVVLPERAFISNFSM